ncbi:MAG: 50S ribosomal protein L28 [Mycoplasmataceae bacterium]|jgi:large subunit ribosomal protein L28|nr:50S ribosomal protein L28 [Mycoplasmataceae bacterium]
MARQDQITKKRALRGNTRSFSMNHSRRTWELNLQNVNVIVGKNKVKRMKVSARTLKSLKRDNLIAKPNR